MLINIYVVGEIKIQGNLNFPIGDIKILIFPVNVFKTFAATDEGEGESGSEGAGEDVNEDSHPHPQFRHHYHRYFINSFNLNWNWARG
jgi:hypothetical protein